MNEKKALQEHMMAVKGYRLAFCDLTERQRMKTEYEIEHFRKRLAREGKTLDIRFEPYSPFGPIVATIRENV